MSRINKSAWYTQLPFKSVKEVTQCTDQQLTSWTAQGVWMLNVRLLSTINGVLLEDKYMFTQTFVESCIEFICRRISARSAKCGFFLWGAFAHKYEPLIDSFNSPNTGDESLGVFKWRHPAPKANTETVPVDLRFINTTNFTGG